MQTVGSYLKSNREAKNISLSDISQYTKISKWYLDCLEKDELKNIPGGPYVKGYISSYAAFVGIDEDEALKKYDSSNRESELSNQAEADIVKNSRFQTLAFIPKKIWILSFIIMIMVLAGGYHFLFQDPENTKLQKSFKNPKQSEFQTPKNQMKELPSEGSKLTQSNSEIQKTAPPNKLERATKTLPEPFINQPATENISKSSEALKTSNTETPLLNTEAVRQNEQIQPNTEIGIKVIKAVAAGGIQNKNAIDTGKSFQWSKGKVYIWSRIACTNPPSSIKHIYFFKEQKVSEVSLEVKSHQWRTWSYKTISDKRYIGQWRVDITTAEDKVLKTIRFEVK